MRRLSIALVGLALLATACAQAPPPAVPVPVPSQSGGLAVRGGAVATVGQARQWATARNAPAFFRDLADIYWREAPHRGGVRADVAYAQSAKETGFGRFGGVIDASFHNPCGLKTRQGGANHDPAAHQRFPDWTTGVRACLDHLALYAGAPGYPRSDSPDPRHFPSIAGTAPTVQELGGRWAPSADYGQSIIDGFLTPMISTAG